MSSSTRNTQEASSGVALNLKEYLESNGIKDDNYLKNFTQEQQHSIIGAFALAVKESRILRASHRQLAAGTVGGTMQYVSVTFQEHGYLNPTLNQDGQLAFIQQQESRSFNTWTLTEKHQAAIPISIIYKINK
jgi:hypothetical protein